MRPEDLPNSDNLVDALYDGLPDEWLSPSSLDDWRIVYITSSGGYEAINYKPDDEKG